MKNLLYIGNKLNTENNNPSSIITRGKLLESEGYKLKYASDFTNKFLRLIDMMMACIRYSNWANVVIIDTYSTQNFYYALVCSQLCRILNIPYYTSLNGGNLPNRLRNSPKLSKLIFQYSFANISPSIYLKNAFKNLGYSNVIFIPNPIEINNYSLIKKDFKAIMLLWVRSFSKIYNPEMAIKVAHRLKELGYTTELCMVGPNADGSLEVVKAKAKALGVNVKFTGKLSKQNWIEKSKDYNIFINTTNFDNMPVSVIEAMALGFPIISTNAGGMPYLINHGEDGLLSPVNDVETMVKHIIAVYENEDLRTYISTNARRKSENFDWNNQKTKWFEILN